MLHGTTVAELAELGGVSKLEILERLWAAGIDSLPSVFEIEMSRALQVAYHPQKLRAIRGSTGTLKKASNRRRRDQVNRLNIRKLKDLENV